MTNKYFLGVSSSFLNEIINIELLCAEAKQSDSVLSSIIPVTARQRFSYKQGIKGNKRLLYIQHNGKASDEIMVSFPTVLWLQQTVSE